jgi:GH25 family lysozyme M1 (1,4-beta-N-acetylmuramidase)
MRPSLRAGVTRAAVLTTAVAAAAATAVVASDPALANGAPSPQPGSGYAGSTLRSHDPAAAKNGTALPALTNTTTRSIGIDVSSYQGNVNWGGQWQFGIRFAYVKATEGTYYTNPYFAQQYNGSYNVGMIRGAYHFGIPNQSAVAQADYFASHGGRWSADGRTLPPALDIEYNPYGATCYGLSQSAMVGWLSAFANEVRKKAGRYPVIYSTTDWWRTCTGNSAALAKTDPIWIANWSSSPGTLPAGWNTWKFWQYSDGGGALDHDIFNGGFAALKAFAKG